MQNATALFCADVDTPDDTLKQAAEAAAREGMHLAVLLHAEFPTLPFNAYGTLPYGSISVPHDWPDTLTAAQGRLDGRLAAVETLLGETGVSADLRRLFAAGADITAVVAQSTRTSDLAFFAPDLRKDERLFHEILHSVLFQSPIPALINGTIGASRDRILLAWNDSLASARAAHAALPYLKSASNVHIVCFDGPTTSASGQIEPGREAATWLSHHGCDVTLTQLPSGGREIGTCILGHAAEIGADLIVAGAYGHSRLREAVFGGTSRTLIEQTEAPVLMAH